MTRAEAKVRIAEIVRTSAPVKTGATLPIRPHEKFNVHRIPLEMLVPNALNDRIAWEVREYEAENKRKLDTNEANDVEYLYRLILKEHPAENDRTEQDLAQHGQLVDGVISNDGVIIDGNRRATLLRKLFKGGAEKYRKSVEDFRCFNAIVLPGDVDAREIMALETMLQIGSDKPVGYNPICLYIKVDNLLGAGYTYTQIKQYMGLKSEKEVETKAAIFRLMQDYLVSIGKKDHYTLLAKLEDPFINTKTVFDRLDNETYNAQWNYTKRDVADFKTVCFDYMRAKFEGKKYRDVLVGKPNKSNGVFINKTVWNDFRKRHEADLVARNPQREEDWECLGRAGGTFEQNLNTAARALTDILDEKDLTGLIHQIATKVDRIAELLKDVEHGLSDRQRADLAAVKDEIVRILG